MENGLPGESVDLEIRWAVYGRTRCNSQAATLPFVARHSGESRLMYALLNLSRVQPIASSPEQKSKQSGKFKCKSGYLGLSH